MTQYWPISRIAPKPLDSDRSRWYSDIRSSARGTEMRPSSKVLEAARGGRGIFGPITVSRSVQMWRMRPTPSHLEIAPGQRSWTMQRETVDGETRGPEWMYIIRQDGQTMLYRTDTAVEGY